MLRGIVQFDTLNEVNIRLSDGSKAFNYDGYTNIIFKVLKADGTAYVNCASDVDTKVVATSPVDGIITVTLAGQATTAVGLCESVLEIYSGDDVMTTARFNYEVFEGLNLDDAVESSTEYPVLKNLIMDVSAVEARVEAAEAERVAAEAIRANEASGYVARAEAAQASASESATVAQASAQVAQEIATGDYATNSGSQAYTNNQISAHNTSGSAHSDIRTLITNANTAVATAQATATAAKTAADNAQATANGKAAAVHKHAAGDITSGILPVARGGTGVATLAELATALSASLGGVKVSVGNYTGSGSTTGTSSKTISLPFTPTAVLVVGQRGVMSTVVNTWSYVYGGLALAGYPAKFKTFEFITIVTNGFTVKSDNGATEAGTNIVCNSNAESYNYIAIG